MHILTRKTTFKDTLTIKKKIVSKSDDFNVACRFPYIKKIWSDERAEKLATAASVGRGLA